MSSIPTSSRRGSAPDLPAGSSSPISGVDDTSANASRETQWSGGWTQQALSWLPLGITQHKVAVAIGVPPRWINEIAHGERRISADTALRLARYFGTSDLFWINLQIRYDIEVERDNLGTKLDDIQPLQSA